VRELVFGGWLCRGIGQHSNLGVPGRDELPHAPPDWPIRLEPGSLNVCIDRFPAQMSRVEDLDNGQFAPAFVIPRNRLRGNMRGDGQVWSAKVGTVNDCWVLRRIGSMVGRQLELVAGRRLLGSDLYIGRWVEVVMYGDWRS
jgi:hypothetical protein